MPAIEGKRSELALTDTLVDERQSREEIARAHRRSAVLAAASKSFAEAGSGMTEVLNAVARSIAEGMGDQCVVRLLSEDRLWISTAAIHHTDPAALDVLRRVHDACESASEGLAGRLLRTGEPMLIPTVDPEELARGIPAAYRPVLDAVPIRSLVAAPLRVGGRVIGLVRASRATSDDAYTAEDAVLLQDLADRASLAIENAQTQSSLRDANTKLEAALAREQKARRRVERAQQRSAVLAAASRSFAEAGSSLAAVLDAIARSVAEEIGDFCVVRLVSDDGEWITTVANHHWDPRLSDIARQVQEERQSVKDGFAGQVVRTGEPILIRAKRPEEIAAGLPTTYHPLAGLSSLGSLVAVPLRSQGRVIGVLGAARHGGKHSYKVDDQILLQDLADRASLAIENARANTKLQESVRLRDAVLAATAHDLRNPLLTIKLAANLLAAQVASPQGVEDSRLLEMLHGIDDTAKKMGEFISDLTDLARCKAGEALDLQRTSTDLVGMVRRVVDAQQSLTASHTLVLDSAVPELVGEWDAKRIERVITNLVENAVKYSMDGGEIMVRVRRELRDFEVWAVLAVEDHGIGIPAEDLPHVFEWFHRAENAAGRARGTGIGLAMAREVTQAHGGTIDVVSAEQAGTTITLRLPLLG